MKIGCDLDGTVFQTYEWMVDYYNRTHKDTMLLSSLMNLPETNTRQAKWMLKYFLDASHYINVPPYPLAIPTLLEISRQHNLVFITSRNVRLQSMTERQLSQYGLTNPLYVVDRNEKVHIYKLFKVQLVLEDDLTFAKELYRCHIPVILFDRAWNQDIDWENKVHKKWKRIYSWDEVLPIISSLSQGGEK